MPSDLWNFACDRYARPGVESACLQLQAKGADVCLLLTAGWLGRRGVTCTPERAEALQQQARTWQQEVITPLRERVSAGARPRSRMPGCTNCEKPSSNWSCRLSATCWSACSNSASTGPPDKAKHWTTG